MVTSAGLFVSSLMGAFARKLQVSLIGKAPQGIALAPGYILSIGVFGAGYYGLDQFKQHNSELLQRRLAVLREQRAQKDIFYNFAEEPEHRLTANRGRFFELLDKYGKAYQ